jgi:hypothetical protein
MVLAASPSCKRRRRKKEEEEMLNAKASCFQNRSNKQKQELQPEFLDHQFHNAMLLIAFEKRAHRLKEGGREFEQKRLIQAGFVFLKNEGNYERGLGIKTNRQTDRAGFGCEINNIKKLLSAFHWIIPEPKRKSLDEVQEQSQESKQTHLLSSFSVFLNFLTIFL